MPACRIPVVIILNTVSLDNAIPGFDIDPGLHYSTLLSFEPDAILVGSATAIIGIDLYLDEVPPEEEGDPIPSVPAPDEHHPSGSRTSRRSTPYLTPITSRIFCCVSDPRVQ